MNEFESIEKELKGLTPKAPSSQLTDKVEIRFGDAGNLAMRRLPEEEVKSSSSEKKSSLRLVALGWNGYCSYFDCIFFICVFHQIRRI